MHGRDAIEALKRRFGLRTDSDLGLKTGMGVSGIQLWKNTANVTSRQLAQLVFKASGAGARRSEDDAIHPVVEFFEIRSAPSPQGKGCVIFAVANGEGKHKYLDGLRTELDSKRGVYIFFDSRGQAIYTGKARKQTLWKEMNRAFNRKRGAVQKIKRVIHPTRLPFKTTEEKSRQIIGQAISLHEIARYFSAYAVSDGLIDDVEALLVRSFANDLLNVRMEKFRRHRTARSD